MTVNRKRITLAFGLFAVVLFVALTVGIFRLRAASGDLYAPYSTFRADPLGTMAVYEALGAIDGLQVSRYLRPFEELPDGRDTAIVIAGAALSPDPVDVLEAVETFAQQGGRVIIAFHPLQDRQLITALNDVLEARDADADRAPGEPDAATESPDEDPETVPAEGHEDDEAPAITDPDVAQEPAVGSNTDAPKDQNQETQDTDGTPAPGTDADKDFMDISERWSFSYGYEDPGDGFQTVAVDGASTPDNAVTWLSGLYFEKLDPQWTPHYIRAGGSADSPWVTVMERALGDGSIVLCSDAYFFSNEALRTHRASALLTWLTAAHPNVLFSEVHLGTEQRDRIMTLVRRYRLHGLFAGLILLGLLFVWKNATTLIPRTERGAARAGQPSTALDRSHLDGLDNLLARFVPADRLPDTCMDEWLHHFHNHPKAAALRETLRNGARGRTAEEVVAAYNRLAAELRNR